MVEAAYETTRKAPMISGRQAADYLNISDNVFFPAIRGGILLAQMEARRQTSTQYSFAVEYLDQVRKVLPIERRKGLTVFTRDVVERLKPINKSWEGREIDWKKDAQETDRVMKELKKRKK